MNTDELLDLLDDTGHPIGTVWRSQMGDTKNIRRCLPQKQCRQVADSPTHRSQSPFPSALDFRVGGGVQAGEDYDDALRREELHLDVDAIGFKLLAEFSPHRSNLSSFMHVYEVLTGDTPMLNPDDFSSAQWLTPAELRRHLQAGAAAKGDLFKVLELLYPA